MGILAWIIVGLIAGWLAGLVMKGGGYGIIGDIIIGIIGGIIGGFIADAIFGVGVSGVNLISIIIAFIGAIILVWIVRALLPGRTAL